MKENDVFTKIVKLARTSKYSLMEIQGNQLLIYFSDATGRESSWKFTREEDGLVKVAYVGEAKTKGRGKIVEGYVEIIEAVLEDKIVDECKTWGELRRKLQWRMKKLGYWSVHE